MAVTKMVPAAILIVVLSATSSMASYADLAGNRNSAPSSGPNGFPASFAQPGNLIGTTVNTGTAESGSACADFCAANAATSQGYNLCDAATCTGGGSKGQCDCKTFEGNAAFYPATAAGEPEAGGWIAGPVTPSATPAAAGATPAAAGAAAAPVTLGEWEQKNLKGSVISTSIMSSYDECAAKCTATPGCKGVNFCGYTGCGMAAQGQCDLKSFDGPADYWPDSSSRKGDGWMSKAAV